MGSQIVKQPNGKYCIYSTIVDNITHYNMEESEIIEEWTDQYNSHIANDVRKTIAKLEQGKKPNFLSKTYEEVMEMIKSLHGAEEHDKVRKLIESPEPEGPPLRGGTIEDKLSILKEALLNEPFYVTVALNSVAFYRYDSEGHHQIAISLRRFREIKVKDLPKLIELTRLLLTDDKKET